MQEILVDGRELGFEGDAQVFKNFVVSAHNADSNLNPPVLA